MGETQMTNQVAQTILNQLGGGRFIAMTGASNLTGRPDGLSFKIGRNSKKVTHVRITLTAMDDYTVEFLNVRGGSVKPVAFCEGVYDDNLQEVFTNETGMYTHL